MSDSPENTEMETKMTRFYRFLRLFALYFGGIATVFAVTYGMFRFVAVVLSGIFAAIVQIQAVFGTSAALAMMFVIIGSGSLGSGRLAQQRDARLTLDKP